MPLIAESGGLKNFIADSSDMKQTPITRYHVWHVGESFGKFDVMAEVTKYIDGLWRMKSGK